MEDTAYCSSDTTALAQALMKVQRNLQPVAKDATNTYIGNRYATLNTVMDACRDLLLENNIWMIQYPVPAPASGGTGALGLVTKLTHVTSGQWQSSLAVAPLPKADPQGYGSCLSYLRRYTLCAMLGIVTEDDDGEGAKKPVQSRAHATRPENASQREKTPSDESDTGTATKQRRKTAVSGREFFRPPPHRRHQLPDRHDGGWPRLHRGRGPNPAQEGTFARRGLQVECPAQDVVEVCRRLINSYP